MRAVLTFTAIGSALWLAASSAQAIGFGRISNPTQLGQPLNFSAVVRLEPDEALPAECVSAEVQSGDNRLAQGQVRVSVDGPLEAGERTVRITTSALIDEPVVTVSVTVGCQAKVTRRFVAFVDPPLINAPQTAFTEPVPPRAEPQTSAIVNAVPRSTAAPRPRSADDTPRDGATPRSRPRPSAPVTVSRAARDGVTAQPAKPRSSTAAARQPNTTARATTTGPRLQLETAAPVIARAASAPPVPAPVATALAAAASAASAPAADAASAAKAESPLEQLAAERQRIQALEDSMAKLAKNSQATQASLLALQARLQDAESERFANPLVYLLAGLVALMALLVALLFWRQTRGTRSAQWWSGPVPTPAPSDAPLTVAPAAAVPVPVPSIAPESAAAPLATDDVFEVPTFPHEEEPPLAAAVAPPRELSVEELMDLEQQAEFFVVLGQDDAAIELLMSHVRTDGGNSPLPYLKLLEIHRRLGDAAAYERIRERFNRRFNAYAPDFEVDPQEGRSLVDYPETIERLQSLWSAPTRVMQTLDASLLSRNKGDATFDLPAYRELLFLYAVARDLAESVGVPPSTGVDLLLPLDDSAEEPVSRLSATSGSSASEYADTATLPVDLNLASNQAATASEPGRGDAARPGFIDFHLDLPNEPTPDDKAR
ncbi:FimV family protein [Rhizobacter sp. Root404]|uniref:type IV pilus assembly protein FimV n=1 Tax=Rhizobacter sp. Root404 TaxID=1736528 RepID=UPI0006F6AEDE|nr:hypothetical protein [Rhizobacter sp. Root404]KQW36491.1 hypothetical protein ASC76_17640 [Rhizobacter sp. Root404]